MMKAYEQKPLGEIRVYLAPGDHSPSLRDPKTGTQARKEPEAGTQAEHGGMLLTTLLPMALSAFFYIA